MRQWPHALLIAISMCLLVGCAQDAAELKNPKPIPVEFKKMKAGQRAVHLSRLKFWHVEGKFSIDFLDPEKQTAFASFAWTQLGRSEYRIRVMSILDIYNAVLFKRFGRVTLWTSKQRHFTAKTPEALMSKVLGWNLPVSSLQYWMVGLPAPGKYVAEYDKFGLLRVLHQQGWDIVYSQYVREKDYALPRVMLLCWPGFKIRIITKYWSLMNTALSVYGTRFD